MCHCLGHINKDVKNFLNDVANICIIEDDETQPHACNQGIAFSTGMKLLASICMQWISLPSSFLPLSLSFSLVGIFNIILIYVLQFCSGDNEEHVELLVLACHTLQRIARQNNQVNAVILFIIVYEFNSFYRSKLKFLLTLWIFLMLRLLCHQWLVF